MAMILTHNEWTRQTSNAARKTKTWVKSRRIREAAKKKGWYPKAIFHNSKSHALLAIMWLNSSLRKIAIGVFEYDVLKGRADISVWVIVREYDPEAGMEAWSELTGETLEEGQEVTFEEEKIVAMFETFTECGYHFKVRRT